MTGRAVELATAVISRRQRDVIEHYLALARDSGIAVAAQAALVADAPAFVVNRLLTRQSSVLMQAIGKVR